MNTTHVTTTSSNWSTQQLAEFLVAVAASTDPPAAMRCAMQWASEVLEAEVAAVVTGDAVVDMIGFPRGQIPVDSLLAAGRESTRVLSLPRVGELHSTRVAVEEIDGHLIVARSADTTDADSLLRNADLAMYRAKLDGVGQHAMYEPDMHVVASDRAHMEGNLRRAVQLEQFEVHYQPIVWLASGEAVGVEALVRWRREDGTLIPPAEFIPVAEDMGLIMPIGRMVMHTSMRQVREWQRTQTNAAALHLSINLSARQLYQPGVVAEVVDALNATGFDPAHLTLEITETALMHDTTMVSTRLDELRAVGARIALDDFGTGYSSLTYLRNFPIDVLKVDKSFIDGIACCLEKANLARGIIELGRTMNLDIVAEGIEDALQVAELVRLRCRMGQGFFLAKGLPAEELSAYLHAQQRDTRGEAERPRGLGQSLRLDRRSPAVDGGRGWVQTAGIHSEVGHVETTEGGGDSRGD
jgi:EAL domain-containing protein (putative c-di-GMP-specific phosphodiesterase class I)